MQTGASALLGAASVATLYSLVRFFDLFRRNASVAIEPQRVGFGADGEAELLPVVEPADPRETIREFVVPVEPQPTVEMDPEVVAMVAPAVSRAGGSRKAKPSRKNGGSRAAATKKSKPAEVVVPEEAEAAVPSETELAHVAGPVIHEEAAHVPHAPLFEPDPFARIQRRAFGRRGQL